MTEKIKFKDHLSLAGLSANGIIQGYHPVSRGTAILSDANGKTTTTYEPGVWIATCEDGRRAIREYNRAKDKLRDCHQRGLIRPATETDEQEFLALVQTLGENKATIFYGRYFLGLTYRQISIKVKKLGWDIEPSSVGRELHELRKNPELAKFLKPK